MGCAFLALRATNHDNDLGQRASVAERYLPVVPERHDAWTSLDGRTRLYAWSAFDEAARGGYFSSDDRDAVAYHGWLQEEESWPNTATVAKNVRVALKTVGLRRLFDQRCGEYAVVQANADGSLGAATDFLGAQHVYYGERDGVVAISNRAFMVAAALDGSGLPGVDPMRLSWLMDGLRAMFGGETLFGGVRILAGDEFLEVGDRGVRLVARTAEAELPTSADWDTHFDELCQRVAWIKRLPEVRFRQTLTGGKDSRLLLGALVASGAVDQLDDCFVEAEPGHPARLSG